MRHEQLPAGDIWRAFVFLLCGSVPLLPAVNVEESLAWNGSSHTVTMDERSKELQGHSDIAETRKQCQSHLVALAASLKFRTK